MNSLTPQQSEILELLRAAGTNGINSFGRGREIALQLPAVIEQLQKKGYIVKAVRRQNRSVDYVLLHVPEALKQAPEVVARPQAIHSIRQDHHQPLTLLDIEGRLQGLRGEYRVATVSRRQIIQRQARALTIAKEKIEIRNQKGGVQSATTTGIS